MMKKEKKLKGQEDDEEEEVVVVKEEEENKEEENEKEEHKETGDEREVRWGEKIKLRCESEQEVRKMRANCRHGNQKCQNAFFFLL